MLFGGFCVLLGCTDLGIVGKTSPCKSACAQGQVCNPALLRCVECATDGNCMTKSDGALPYCDGQSSTCVECRDQHDCQAPTPLCAQGTCQRASDDGTGHASDDSAGHDSNRPGTGGTGK
jgi:hypothetical protein